MLVLIPLGALGEIFFWKKITAWKYLKNLEKHTNSKLMSKQSQNFADYCPHLCVWSGPSGLSAEISADKQVS